MNRYLELLTNIAKVKFCGRPIPLMCHWEITYRCNLNCVFCVTRFAEDVWRPETTPAQALDILAQVAKMGTKILNIVGGEPTRRSDLPQIIKHAHSLGMKVVISTNGIMEEQRRYWLLDADIIRVSLEGAPSLNNILRCSDSGIDSCAQAIQTLRFLKKHGQNPIIASTYTAKTRQEDVEFLLQLARELKIKINFNPVGFGFSDKRECFTTQDYQERRRRLADTLLPLQDSLKRIGLLRKRYPDSILSGEPTYTILKHDGLEKFGCLAMTCAICLKPDGSVAMPCIEFPQTVVKEKDIASVFYGAKAELARKNQGKFWFCEDCKLTCMILATTLVKIGPLFHLAWQYLPQVLLSKQHSKICGHSPKF